MSTPVGAKCAECPLFDPAARPVCMHNHEKSLTVVSDFPDIRDVDTGVPLVGPQGVELSKLLESAGLTRKDVAATYAVKCRYPQGDKKGFLARLQKLNSDRKRRGDAPIMTPAQACAGSLLHDLQGRSQVLAFGDAVKSLLPGNPTVQDVRGGAVPRPQGWLMPLVSLDQSRAQPKWRWVTEVDIAKALRFFEGNRAWLEPHLHPNPGAATLRKFF